MTEDGSGGPDDIAVACDRASKVFAGLAVLAFLASFPLVSTDWHTAAISGAGALTGASLLSGGVSGLRYPERKIGDTVPSPGVSTDETIRSRAGARAAARLYAGIGIVLFVVFGYVALGSL